MRVEIEVSQGGGQWDHTGEPVVSVDGEAEVIEIIKSLVALGEEWRCDYRWREVGGEWTVVEYDDLDMSETPLADAYVDAAKSFGEESEKTQAARAAWLASDEEREYEFGGESLPGDSEDGHYLAPSQVLAELEAWSQDGWGNISTTIHVINWARPLDPYDGSAIEAYCVTETFSIHPDEDDTCQHAWKTPYAIVGGSEANPGVWSNGGGVIIKEVCAKCGAYKVTDTWAQSSDGIQGLTSVKYLPPDEESAAWAEGNEEG